MDGATQGQSVELSKKLVASFSKNNGIMLTVCGWRMFVTFGGCDLCDPGAGDRE